MVNRTSIIPPAHAHGPETALRSVALVSLIRRIAVKGDAAALRELLEQRTPFRLADGPPLSLAELLAHWQSASWVRDLCGHAPVAVDRAYDLTVSKFFERPRRSVKGRRKGPDCRRYYRGFLTVLSKWRDHHPSAGAVEEEAAAAVLFQRYVRHQFRKSCQEARRSANPARSRYTWRLPSGTIVVYMPASITRRQRRPWLETHIDDPDPTRPGERERVQAILDAHLGVPHHVPIDGNGDGYSALSADTSPRSPLDVVITVEGLARAVADEKADNLDLQRPKIQELGSSGLRRFILRVFQDLGDGCYDEKRLAMQFRRSRPTVSRFAGSRWRTRSDSLPPDLFVNVAEVLAANDDYVEAAKATGVWPRLQQVIQRAARSRIRRRHRA